jgi:hypothetical protein
LRGHPHAIERPSAYAGAALRQNTNSAAFTIEFFVCAAHPIINLLF